MKKRKFICAIVILLFCLTAVLSACSYKDKKWTPSNIASKLTYSEEAKRTDFAKEKPGAHLAQNQLSAAVVEYASDTSDDLKESAGFLAETLNRIFGSESIVAQEETAQHPSSSIHFSLGNTARNSSLSLIDVKDDGYAVKITETAIQIKGLNDMGTQNGIYGFLEDKLEVMFVSNDYDYVPFFPTVYLASEEYVDNPSFSWRKVFQYETLQNGWYKKLKNNGTAATENFEGENAGWGTWCHNVFDFVPPKEYFESNPEFYSEIDGERKFEIDGIPTQLCLTNTDLYAVIEKNMAKKITENPRFTYWDFSINDNYSYCQCKNCKNSYKRYGSRMGAMLGVINKLAEKFPDKIISTLAYFYNSTPPKDMTCRENVNITIAPIATGQAYSYLYGDTPGALKAKKMIEQWSAVSERILVWDYTVDFAHLLLPYPNYDVQALNLQFYEENNVKSVFHQGSREKNDEMASFRSYILSKQLWNRKVDWQSLAGKYLQVYYGGAAEYIAQYLDAMSQTVYQKAGNLDLYDSPASHANDYLSTSQIEKYMRLIDSAKVEIATDSVLSERLELIEINILYAKMFENSFDFNGKEAAYTRFSELVKKHEIKRESEGGKMDNFLNGGYENYLNRQKKIPVMIGAILPASIIGISAVAFSVVIIIKKKKHPHLKKQPLDSI